MSDTPTTPAKPVKSAKALATHRPGVKVELPDGRTGKLLELAKDSHVPAWYVEGIAGPVPTEFLTPFVEVA